jgi:hypothetical protein
MNIHAKKTPTEDRINQDQELHQQIVDYFAFNVFLQPVQGIFYVGSSFVPPENLTVFWVEDLVL